MTTAITKTGKQSTDVAIGNTDGLTGLEGFKPSRPSMAKAKIIHPKGVFEITEKDGSKSLVQAFADVVLLDVSSGRIRWLPQAEGGNPGDGNWTCRSRDGEMPESGGSHTGPCDSCPAAKWGGKINGKAQKPQCDETINVVFGRKNADPVLISFSKSSFKPMRDFLTANFVNEGRPLYTRYVTFSLREETYSQLIYQVIVPLLGKQLDANAQKEAFAAARAVKGLSSVNPEELNVDNDTAKEQRESKPTQTATRTVEVSASPVPAPANRMKEITEAAKVNNKTLADAIKIARETFGCGIPQLTEGNTALLKFSLISDMDIDSIMAVAQENIEVTDPKEVSVEMVEMIAQVLEIPWN